MKLNLNDLKKFMIEAINSGYAHPEKADVTKEKDHSTTIRYRKGDWHMHDNFFGGEPYGGREVIFYKDKPVFIMVYYGRVNGEVDDVDQVYKFLQKALLLAPENNPYRGPKELKENNLEYRNNWQGEIESFKGEEVILRDGQQVYSASYMGGLVDIRSSGEI